MTASLGQPVRRVGSAENARLESRLRREADVEVLFDAPSRGRYATDASIYQVTPLGVAVPRTSEAASLADPR